jgi:serine/threonine protein kinase
MQVICEKCSRALDFSGEPPSFCAYCGQALRATALHTPSSHDPEALTIPAAPPTPSGTAIMPQGVGGFRLVRQLGAGGMGGVYEAEENDSGRRVALKLIAPELAASPETVERFRQEGRIASMVAHPRCVFVHAVDEDAGRPYIVMELMPGETLKDLVDKKGPLPVEEAIAKTLDVIDGLLEAHRLEVIHRDVKPSNCFLEPDGRVKIGDFGLAKSLSKDPHLTKTGSFVGTPYFASPEQVRGEAIDRQTDVYSVAATLYYLLTGQPPFWGSDSAATLARIVSDPPPSLRTLKPELSPALDRTLLRGLDRDRKRRWQSLEDFKAALLALRPVPLSQAGLGLRLLGYLIDLGLIGLVSQSLLIVLLLTVPATKSWTSQAQSAVLALLLGVAYFSSFIVLEHVAGCSLGKALFRLRVCSPEWIDPPQWGPTALRTAVCFGLLHLPALLTIGVMPGKFTIAAPLTALGVVALCWPMRERNNWRGWHELLSGTRVASLPSPRPDENLLASGGWLLSMLQSRGLDRGAIKAGPLPQRVGGFAVRGALKRTAGETVLLGEDSSFGRRVFLWLRPLTSPSLDRARRDVGRRTRLRWLTSGKQGDLQWDAILAPSGCPLPDYVRSEGSLAWPQGKILLQDLAEELTAACAEGTLPRFLSPAQVWVQADGRARLADIALRAGENDQETLPGGTDQERCLALLSQMAVLALEGQARSPEDPIAPIWAAMPEKARAVLDRLLGVKARYDSMEQLRDDLKGIEHE